MPQEAVPAPFLLLPRNELLCRLHYEKLKAIREQLLHQTAADGLLVDGRQNHHVGLGDDKSEQAIATTSSSGLSQQL